MASNWMNNFNDKVHTEQSDLPPQYEEIADVKNTYVQDRFDETLVNLRYRARDTAYQLNNSKVELNKLKESNKILETKIEESKQEKHSLERKIESLKTKLLTLNGNVTRFNEDRDALRVNLSESQIQVARLEERLSACTLEHDSLKNPANPESNVNIRKLIISGKREIKKLRAELENERMHLEEDNKLAQEKDNEMREVENEYNVIENELKAIEIQKDETCLEETDVRNQKEEILKKLELIRLERKSYDQRLKEAKVQLGVKIAGKNVNVKLSHEIKVTEKTLLKQVTTLEKRLKDAMSDLDVLRNRHKMSKTAQSINIYTRRNRGKRDGEGKFSLADSGIGNVKFTSAKPKDASKTSEGRKANTKQDFKNPGGGDNGSDKTKRKDGTKAAMSIDLSGVGSYDKVSDGLATKTSQRMKRNQTGTTPNTGRSQTEGSTSRSPRKTGSNGSSVSFVPAPKPKLL